MYRLRVFAGSETSVLYFITICWRQVWGSCDTEDLDSGRSDVMKDIFDVFFLCLVIVFVFGGKPSDEVSSYFHTYTPNLYFNVRNYIGLLPPLASGMSSPNHFC